MNRQLRGALILFFLMIAIWALVIGSEGSKLRWLLLIGALWATFDFARALWRVVDPPPPSDEDEQI